MCSQAKEGDDMIQVLKKLLNFLLGESAVDASELRNLGITQEEIDLDLSAGRD